jgi:7-cyano-7-deazaguanine reductase
MTCRLAFASKSSRICCLSWGGTVQRKLHERFEFSPAARAGSKRLQSTLEATNLTPDQSQLGKPTRYAEQYEPGLLFPMARAPDRAAIGAPTGGADGALPFMGADLWTAFELGWLNLRGKPQVAIAHLVVPCESSHMIESKSLKLYLGSFANSRFESADAVRDLIRRDLGAAASGLMPGIEHTTALGCAVGVRLLGPELWETQKVAQPLGRCLDRLDIECTHTQPAPELLTATANEQPVTEVLYTDLLKSNCLVTGQPDWGSLEIRYSGPSIDEAGLLRYIVSHRNQNEFHEQCVERMFMDIWRQCRPTTLSLYARYTRRGGLDINPFRTSAPAALPANVRWARQ